LKRKEELATPYLMDTDKNFGIAETIGCDRGPKWPAKLLVADAGDGKQHAVDTAKRPPPRSRRTCTTRSCSKFSRK
jgi:hypothetical protein